MNTIIQNTLVIAAVGFAIIFLVKKFFWKKPKSKKACGSNGDCGCH
ncbi:FeoB-associated Cys-rich membrane protein [Tamlana crocina]